MNALIGHPFLKMNGLGNEIVVLDLRGQRHVVTPAEARAIAADPASHFDQLMVLNDPRTPGTHAFMLIYNVDGSLSASCGNGTRCVAWALTRDGARDELLLETEAGLLACRREGEWLFTIDMGAPRLRWDEIPLAEEFRDTRAIELQIGPIDAPALHSPSVVSMGNPHAIFWVEDVEAHDLARLGPLLENHPIFPEKANISLAAVKSPEHVVVKVWERGAGLTRACGSAACAVAVAAARKGLAGRKVRITLPGGDLFIDWRESDGHVMMTGPVELEHEGRFAPELFAETA
ncbi:diaminopimelate epimerase [Chelatococcus daeguensis]|uniref:Diaminopimelate epimerase n=1 Tax=Chelatococcus daeguensis TaxID=444444 RepID=A0AAC9JMQ0_9HYPH|nr:diaminopimelate epimerase [Chelatococcus daeguensis]APF36573.1 diaminopimelate epimerase [Chelatococcus daeguensis]